MSVMARRWNHLRTSRVVLTGLWADACLVMAASAWNGGLAFEALGQHRGEGIALGVAVDVALAVSLVGDRALHLHGKSSAWGRALRVTTAFMSLALNCGVAIWQGHYGLACFHAFLPVLLVLLSEYAQDTTLKFGEIADEREAAEQAERDAQLKADREAWEAEQARRTSSMSSAVTSPAVPVPPAAPPRFDPSTRPVFTPAVGSTGRPEPAGPGRPDDHPADRPAKQPAAGETGAKTGRRSGATRRPTRKRSDEQLLGAIRELTDRNGGDPPTQYAVRQALGVGGPKAARLLDELATTAPAGQPGHNGSARKEGTP